MSDLILLKTYSSRFEAEIGKGKLKSNGIKAIILADDEGGMAPFPFQPNSKGVQLLINQKDYNKAHSLIK